MGGTFDQRRVSDGVVEVGEQARFRARQLAWSNRRTHAAVDSRPDSAKAGRPIPSGGPASLPHPRECGTARLTKNDQASMLSHKRRESRVPDSIGGPGLTSNAHRGRGTPQRASPTVIRQAL